MMMTLANSLCLIGLLAGLSWLGAAIWRALTLPRRARRAPACERCGYSVEGLAGLTCPECGTDLRKTGIITALMEVRRRGGRGGAIYGWTVVCLVGIGAVANAASPWSLFYSLGWAPWRVPLVPIALLFILVWGYGLYLIEKRWRRLLREGGSD